MSLLDTFLPLIYAVTIIGVSYFPLKKYFEHRLSTFKAKKNKEKSMMDMELENWVMAAIENPHIAIEQVEKEIQELEIKGEKGFPYQFALMKKQALEFAAANPQLAKAIGPGLVKRGFKLWKKLPKMIEGIGI